MSSAIKAWSNEEESSSLPPKLQNRRLKLLALFPLAIVLFYSSIKLFPTNNIIATKAATSDVVDATTLSKKVMTGYQGWFGTTCEHKNKNNNQDGVNEWRHWTQDFKIPGPKNVHVAMWPDLRDYDDDELCSTDFYYNLDENNNEEQTQIDRSTKTTTEGRNAKLYSAWNVKTVKRHIRWMQEYNIDGAFVQRFLVEVSPDKIMRKFRDKVLQNVQHGCEEYGRVFANMYDISGHYKNVYDDIKKDWMYLVDTLQITKSNRYLHHNQKPVLAIWGFGFESRIGEPEAVLELIDWFQNTAKERYRVTLLGGVPAHWRTLSHDSKTDVKWGEVYRSFDIISPWAVGRFAHIKGADSFRKNVNEEDIAECVLHGVEYLPVVFPGYSFHNADKEKKFNEIPRNGGTFFWHQMYNAINVGSTQLYVSMFDEVDEGTAIFKIAETLEQTPTKGKFVTLDQDGFNVPSDWYLRLAGYASDALRKDGRLPIDMPPLPKSYVMLE